ncbi:hypothetical protein GCM10027037_24910 [Mucilaginibacter koreensis]
MKKFIAYAVLLCIVLGACRKGHDPQISTTDISKIAYLGQNVISNAGIQNWFSKKEIGKYISVDWSKAQQNIVDGVPVVKVPVKGIHNAAVMSATQTKSLAVQTLTNDTLHYFNPEHPPMLFFFADKKATNADSIKALLMNFYPDDPSKENGKDKIWTGKLVEWNMEGDKVYIQQLNKSYPEQKGVISLSQISSSTNSKSQVQVLSTVKQFNILSDIWNALKKVVEFIGYQFGFPGHYNYYHDGTDLTWCDFLWGMFCGSSAGPNGDIVTGGGSSSAPPNYIAIYNGYVDGYNGSTAGNQWIPYDGSGNTSSDPCDNSPHPLATTNGVKVFYADPHGCPVYMPVPPSNGGSIIHYSYDDIDGDFDFDYDINGTGDPNPIPLTATHTFELLSLGTFSDGRKIGSTNNRGNTEDMTYGTNADVSKITSSETSKTTSQLFDGMTDLMHTFSMGELQNATDQFVQRFRNNTGGTYENYTVNKYVSESNEFKNFVSMFNDILDSKLKAVNGDLSKISEIKISNALRMHFGGLYNRAHGLQILINDTEYTEIQVDNYSLLASGKWAADITITVHDHFGLDLHDAVEYQGWNNGFADWWLLQHDRGVKPFETLVRIGLRINGSI